VAEQLARRYAQGSPRSRFQGEAVECLMGARQEQVLVLCPHTLMNRSGASVRAACDFYKLPLSELLVVCDDFNLPLARLRCRPKGSSGGQKGLQDILRCLGSDEFARLRIGIGTPPAGWDAAAFVLSKFAPDELAPIEAAIQRAANAAADWVDYGIQYCMNRYNAEAASDA
jgi:PTH1 family peptidyl-tRNA hydrolase